MGLVAGHRCAASELGSDDPESDVRERGDRSGSPADRHWCCPVQDHEGEGLVLKSATGNRNYSYSYSACCECEPLSRQLSTIA